MVEGLTNSGFQKEHLQIAFHVRHDVKEKNVRLRGSFAFWCIGYNRLFSVHGIFNVEVRLTLVFVISASVVW
jgi:hypothetical protein